MAKLTSTPAVGDGITIHGWTDSHAFTVLAVSESGKIVKAQRDKATRTNGADDTTTPGGFFAHREGRQEWAYEPDPLGEVVRVTLRKDGTFRQANTNASVSEGRHEHYDYNF